MGARERFIADTLEEEGRRLYHRQTEAISSGYQRGTGRLATGRTVSSSSVSDADGRLSLTHPVYERFLDIRNRRHKNLRIHNRFVFGAYASIANRLMYGFTEEVAEAFKALDTKG